MKISNSGVHEQDTHPAVKPGGAAVEALLLGPLAMSATFCLMIDRVSFQPSEEEGEALNRPLGLVLYLSLHATCCAHPEQPSLCQRGCPESDSQKSDLRISDKSIAEER